MKKMNYVRPLAEVIEVKAQDIITASGVFSQTTAGGGATGGHELTGVLNTTIDGGVIKLN